MKITKLPKALSQALRKFKPLRKDINLFKTSLSACLSNIAIAEENKEHEENFKKYIADFLKQSLYQDHLINTKGRIDLAIYSGKDANSHISVLIEVKRPSNVNEFPSANNINKKALHELLLYYLQERVDKQNNNIKHLIATNGYEWYLFKGEDFYTHFYKNAALQKEYAAFRDGEKDSSKNELFYKEIAHKYLEQVGDALDYVYFNAQDYKSYLDLENKQDNKLVSLYKTLSSTHLLNKAFGNDSNQLNKAFYGELLHIIGLEEVKQKGKKVIQRLPVGKRDYGSLLESTIFTLEDRDYLYKASNLREYGSNKEEQLFNIGLELCLTWINRVLFIKLLESQLLDYHDGNQHYRFLHQDFIRGFDELEALFFSALAKKKSERSERHQDRYQYIPYLNSSLFEPNELEREVMQLSNVKDETIQLYSKTVLKDGNNKRLTGSKDTLAYLFEFLEAYDFSTDNKNEVEEGEQNKALINASVFFEKINGYKDGSFYTPSYITMYMSRETLRRAVVQKMNTHYNWKCSDFDDLKEELRDHLRAQGKTRQHARLEANKVINSLKICDPAVGSGHFLVSCLNELIAIKSDLKILCDAKGERLDTYVSLENDELVLEDENGDFFTYNPSVARTHATQKALFHEKQTLIEHCLFAVDINPNSVKICRLRLWIELLKNAYYNQDDVLQTLPNIDINIKCGNSLISRFDLADDLKSAFRSNTNPYSLKDYKNAVQEYKTTNDKARKREIERIIGTIKSNFKTFLSKKQNDKYNRVIYKYNLKKEELENLGKFGAKVNKKDKAALKKLKTAASKAQITKEETLNNAIYQNAFEWRFEFPEVLDNTGKFVGFDVVIGNPPYIRHEEIKWMKPYLKKRFETFAGTADLYVYFVEQAFNVMKEGGEFAYILPNKWMRAGYGKALRQWIDLYTIHEIIDFGDLPVFEEATTYPSIFSMQKSQPNSNLFKAAEIKNLQFKDLTSYLQTDSYHVNKSLLSDLGWSLVDDVTQYLLEKIRKEGTSLGDYVEGKVYRGVLTGLNEAFVIDEKIKERLIEEDKNSIEVIKPFLKGKDIKRYKKPIGERHLILFKSKDTEAWFGKLDESEAWEKLSDRYPSVCRHLKQYEEDAKKRADQGQYWWELRACAYYNEFEKSKIMLPDIALQCNALYDNKGYYCANTGYIILGLDLVHLGLLNSKLLLFFYSNLTQTIRGGYYRFIRQYLEQLPIKENIPNNYSNNILTLVQEVITKQQDPNANTSQLEQEIDVLVYQLYNLTYEEVLIIDKDFPWSRAAYEKGRLEQNRE